MNCVWNIFYAEYKILQIVLYACLTNSSTLGGHVRIKELSNNGEISLIDILLAYDLTNFEGRMRYTFEKRWFYTSIDNGHPFIDTIYNSDVIHKEHFYFRIFFKIILIFCRKYVEQGSASDYYWNLWTIKI